MAAQQYILALLGAAAAAHGHFVPACIAEQCSAEAIALGNDEYTKSITSCAVHNFGPCASKAWDCLGDASCRQVLTCGPKVFDTCKADIWKILTDPDEREKLMCIANCTDKDGHISPFCVAEKCGKASIQCLTDSTCRHVAECLPKALTSCSLPAFKCVVGLEKECHENLQCLGHGAATCFGPAVNLMTDSKIADFVGCAGTKCPHPNSTSAIAVASQPVEVSEPGSTATQLLCMAEKCSSKALKILEGQDVKDLVSCAAKADLPKVCSSVWDCLGDKTCANDVSCMVKPFETCKDSLWQVLTTPVERQRIEQTAACLHKCEGAHPGNFVDATFCVLDTCSQSVLDCYHDNTCREAVKCLPNTVGQCAMPTLDAYAHDQLFQNSMKCIGRGLESCGRGAVEMMRDQDIAEAVRCASQCTRTPESTSNVIV